MSDEERKQIAMAIDKVMQAAGAIKVGQLGEAGDKLGDALEILIPLAGDATNLSVG